MAQLVKNPPAMRETWDLPWVGKILWRRERLPTPLFWPGEFYGLYSPWGRKESDMTERLSLHFHCIISWINNLFFHFPIDENLRILFTFLQIMP